MTRERVPARERCPVCASPVPDSPRPMFAYQWRIGHADSCPPPDPVLARLSRERFGDRPDLERERYGLPPARERFTAPWNTPGPRREDGFATPGDVLARPAPKGTH